MSLASKGVVSFLNYPSGIRIGKNTHIKELVKIELACLQSSSFKFQRSNCLTKLPSFNYNYLNVSTTVAVIVILL